MTGSGIPHPRKVATRSSPRTIGRYVSPPGRAKADVWPVVKVDPHPVGPAGQVDPHPVSDTGGFQPATGEHSPGVFGAEMRPAEENTGRIAPVHRPGPPPPGDSPGGRLSGP